MVNINPKLFDNESPENHPLRFTQGCDIGQIIMIREYIYFIAKENSLELLKAFHYGHKFLLGRSVVTIWIAQYYLEEGNRFVVMTDNRT